ncbi:MAG: hypothetical protein ACPGXL_09100 [Chitinophagales bacterium]
MKKTTSLFPLIFGCIFIFSCKQTHRSDVIIAFEKALGKQETIYLNEMVATFDQFLADEYPTRKPADAFKTYLIRVEKNGYEPLFFPTVDSLDLRKYKASPLFSQYDTIFPDSIWIEGHHFFMDYNNSIIDDDTIPMPKVLSFPPPTGKSFHTDSIIQSLKNEPKYNLIDYSKFYLALDTINQTDKYADSLFLEYIDAKEKIGLISSSMIAHALLYRFSEHPSYLHLFRQATIYAGGIFISSLKSLLPLCLFGKY